MKICSKKKNVKFVGRTRELDKGKKNGMEADDIVEEFLWKK